MTTLCVLPNIGDVELHRVYFTLDPERKQMYTIHYGTPFMDMIHLSFYCRCVVSPPGFSSSTNNSSDDDHNDDNAPSDTTTTTKQIPVHLQMNETWIQQLVDLETQLLAIFSRTYSSVIAPRSSDVVQSLQMNHCLSVTLSSSSSYSNDFVCSIEGFDVSTQSLRITFTPCNLSL
jgi:hypothetical protein